MANVLMPIPQGDDLREWAESITATLQKAIDADELSGGGNSGNFFDSRGRPIMDEDGLYIYDGEDTIISPVLVQINTQQLVDAAITTDKIADLSVDVQKLADLSVEAAKLADSSVTTTKIANAAVGSAAIANAAIGTAHIANAAITSAKIGDAEIVDAKIDSLTANKITTGVLGSGQAITLNGTLRYAKTSFADTASGFWLRQNTFHVGDASNYLSFDGSSFVLATDKIGAGASNAGVNSVALGSGSSAGGGSSVAIGRSSSSGGSESVSVGRLSTANHLHAISIGYSASSSGNGGVSLGHFSTAGQGSLALGAGASASASFSGAIGNQATATHADSIAIGTLSATTAIDQIRLGRSGDHVSIPGALDLNSGNPNTVGQLGFCRTNVTGDLEAGDTTAGSNLTFVSANALAQSGALQPTGTWKCLGYAYNNSAVAESRTSLFVRIA